MIAKLLKVQLQAQFSSIFARGKKRGRAAMIGLGLLMLYGFAMVAVYFGMIALMLCESLTQAGLDGLYFALMTTLALILAFVGSVASTQMQLFRAKDNERLLAMPIPPSAILTSRIFTVTLWHLFFVLLVMVPTGIVYGMCCPVGLGFILRYTALTLCVGLLAVTMTSICAWVVARITVRLPGKKLLSMVLTLVFFALYMMAVNRLDELMTMLLMQAPAVEAVYERNLAPLMWFGQGMAGRIAPALGAAVLGLLSFGLVWWLLSRSFVRIVTTERGQRRKRYVARSMQVRSLRKAMLQKEWQHLWGQPMYFLNAALGTVFMAGAAVFLLIKPTVLTDMLALLPETFRSYLPLACALVCCAMNSVNELTAPSVSLEGKHLWILRSAPIPTEAILWGKMDLHLMICLPPTLLLCLVLGFVLGCGLLGGILMMAMAALHVLFSALLGLMMNLRFPKFDFINEIAVVKQSASVALTLLAGLGFELLMIGVSVALCLLTPLPGNAVLAIGVGVLALACFGLMQGLKTWGVRRLESF